MTNLLAIPLCILGLTPALSQGYTPPGATAGGYTTLMFSDYFLTFDQASDPYRIWWTETAVIGVPSGGAFTLLGPGLGLKMTTGPTGLGSALINHPVSQQPWSYGGWMHGYFEAAIRLSTTSGSLVNSWGAFWLESKSLLEGTAVDSSGTKNWCELDIFEALGHNSVDGTEHWWTWPSGGTMLDSHNPNSLISGLPGDPLDGQYHQYGLLWQPGKVTWYFDNTPIATFTSFPGCDTQPMTLIVSINSHTDDEQEADVGWVRVWQ